MAGTLVLGLGNILLGDEGAGIRVIQRLLERYDLPKGVQAIDGGTLGMALLPYLEDASRLVLVDAIQADRAPGTLLRLVGEQMVSFLQEPAVACHQQSLHNLVATAVLQGYLPDDMVFWGVQVGSAGVGLTLSPPVAAGVDTLVDSVLAELARWDVHPQPRAH
jgi:hydrogenase maturation protease